MFVFAPTQAITIGTGGDQRVGESIYLNNIMLNIVAAVSSTTTRVRVTAVWADEYH